MTVTTSLWETPVKRGDRGPSVPTALAALPGEAPHNEGMRTASPDRGAATSGENTNTNTTGKKGTTGKCGICQRQRPLDEKVSVFTWDRECERAYASLSWMANQEDEESWWEEVTAGLKKLSTAASLLLVGGAPCVARASTMSECKESLKCTKEIRRRTTGKDDVGG